MGRERVGVLWDSSISRRRCRVSAAPSLSCRCCCGRGEVGALGHHASLSRDRCILLCRLFPQPVEKAVQQMFLEDTQAAGVCIAPGSLAWRRVGFDSLVPEGHGLCRRAFVEVFLGLVGGVVS